MVNTKHNMNNTKIQDKVIQELWNYKFDTNEVYGFLESTTFEIRYDFKNIFDKTLNVMKEINESFNNNKIEYITIKTANMIKKKIKKLLDKYHLIKSNMDGYIELYNTVDLSSYNRKKWVLDDISFTGINLTEIKYLSFDIYFTLDDRDNENDVSNFYSDLNKMDGIYMNEIMSMYGVYKVNILYDFDLKDILDKSNNILKKINI